MSRLSQVIRRRAEMLLLCSALCITAAAWGQQPASYSRSTAIDQANSRAEHEAEQMVSLSADRILSILRQEPGLLLQVKKELVRKAFEQGRILDPNDLTDDALFTLIRQDDNIRVIATHEIVDRAYVKAKPTREELARDLPCRQLMPTGPETVANKQLDQAASNTTSVKRPPSQEEEYWLKHENDLDCYLTQYLPYGTAALFIRTTAVHSIAFPATISSVAIPTPAIPTATIPAAVSSTTISALSKSSAGSVNRTTAVSLR